MGMIWTITPENVARILVIIGVIIYIGSKLKARRKARKSLNNKNN